MEDGACLPVDGVVGHRLAVDVDEPPVGQRAQRVVDDLGGEDVVVALLLQQRVHGRHVFLVRDVGHENGRSFFVFFVLLVLLVLLARKLFGKGGGHEGLVEVVARKGVDDGQARGRRQTGAAVVHDDVGVGMFGGDLVDTTGAVGGVGQDINLFLLFVRRMQGRQGRLQQSNDARGIAQHRIGELQGHAPALGRMDLAGGPVDFKDMAQLVVCPAGQRGKVGQRLGHVKQILCGRRQHRGRSQFRHDVLLRDESCRSRCW